MEKPKQTEFYFQSHQKNCQDGHGFTPSRSAAPRRGRWPTTHRLTTAAVGRSHPHPPSIPWSSRFLTLFVCSISAVDFCYRIKWLRCIVFSTSLQLTPTLFPSWPLWAAAWPSSAQLSSSNCSLGKQRPPLQFPLARLLSAWRACRAWREAPTKAAAAAAESSASGRTRPVAWLRHSSSSSPPRAPRLQASGERSTAAPVARPPLQTRTSQTPEPRLGHQRPPPPPRRCPWRCHRWPASTDPWTRRARLSTSSCSPWSRRCPRTSGLATLGQSPALKGWREESCTPGSWWAILIWIRGRQRRFMAKTTPGSFYLCPLKLVSPGSWVSGGGGEEREDLSSRGPVSRRRLSLSHFTYKISLLVSTLL